MSDNYDSVMGREYDFYILGQRFANETMVNLIKKTQEIKDKYGEEASFDFETGIISTISDYEYVSDCSFEVNNVKNISGTINYSIKNEINKSYLDGIGMSKQYLTNSSGKIICNETRRI